MNYNTEFDKAIAPYIIKYGGSAFFKSSNNIGLIQFYSKLTHRNQYLGLRQLYIYPSKYCTYSARDNRMPAWNEFIPVLRKLIRVYIRYDIRKYLETNTFTGEIVNPLYLVKQGHTSVRWKFEIKCKSLTEYLSLL